MASYYGHDAYDSRPQRAPHRTESFSRPTQNEAYLRPGAGRSHENGSSQDQSGERRSAGPRSPTYYSNRSYNRDTYDSRYDGRQYDPRYSNPPRRSPSRARKRRSWPPQPFVEDEVSSLKKEAGTEKLLKAAGADEVASRGSIDQEPIIEDVPELINKDERRFVHVPKLKPASSTSTSASGLLTPPSSEDERQRRASRRPSKLDMSFKQSDNHAPEMDKRVSTPYSFTRSAQTPQSQPSAARFTSPDLLSPPQANRRAPGSKSQPSSPRRDSAQYSPSAERRHDYFAAGYSGYSGDESAIDDAGYDTSDSVGSSGPWRNKPLTHRTPSGKKPDQPNKSPDTSVVDFAGSSQDVPIRRANLDARRNTDTTGTLPTIARPVLEKMRRPTPLAAASALSDLNDAAASSSLSSPRLPSEMPLPRSREPSYASSRGPSPTAVPDAYTTVPSSRFSVEQAREQSSTSSPASKAGSVEGSRPSSPSPRTPGDSPRLLRTDLDWSVLMAANAARRPKTSSRLATSQSQIPQTPELPKYPRPDISRSYSAAQAPRTGTMPYPINDGPSTPSAYMPSERSYQYFKDQTDSARPRIPPEKRATMQTTYMPDADTASRRASPAPFSPASYGSSDGGSRLIRPTMPIRHSTAELPQIDHRHELERPRTSDSKRSSYSGTTQPKDDLQALMRRKISPCHRTEPSSAHDDWYTLVGASSLDFCPDCVRSNLNDTRFHDEVKRSPRYSRESRIQCALGGQPWIRLAFLLTLQRERPDLGYLRDMADFARTTDNCPGNSEDPGPWYGLRDSDNFFIRDFRVCFLDVRRIERLFSSLSGQFVRQPDRNSVALSGCAMRAETNRFWTFLTSLAMVHEQSMVTRMQAELAPFVNLVELKSRSAECTRDTFLTGGLWHFIPQVPEFTVCGECFEHVIIPEIQKHKDIAMRFNHSVQPVPGERKGSSCMLYSKRTRRWFKDAIDGGDMKYLVKRARERKDEEVYLQDRYTDVQRRMVNAGSETMRQLEKEVQWISEQWQKVE